MSRFWTRFGLIVVILAGLSACGQKGPLYLPDSAELPDSTELPDNTEGAQSTVPAS